MLHFFNFRFGVSLRGALSGMRNFVLFLALCSYQFSCSIRLISQRRDEQKKNLLFLSYFRFAELMLNFLALAWILSAIMSSDKPYHQRSTTHLSSLFSGERTLFVNNFFLFRYNLKKNYAPTELQHILCWPFNSPPPLPLSKVFQLATFFSPTCTSILKNSRRIVPMWILFSAVFVSIRNKFLLLQDISVNTGLLRW